MGISPNLCWFENSKVSILGINSCKLKTKLVNVIITVANNRCHHFLPLSITTFYMFSMYIQLLTCKCNIPWSQNVPKPPFPSLMISSCNSWRPTRKITCKMSSGNIFCKSYSALVSVVVEWYRPYVPLRHNEGYDVWRVIFIWVLKVNHICFSFPLLHVCFKWFA